MFCEKDKTMSISFNRGLQYMECYFILIGTLFRQWDLPPLPFYHHKKKHIWARIRAPKHLVFLFGRQLTAIVREGRGKMGMANRS